MYSFGAGVLQAFRNDTANNTPINFGLVQEVTLDFSFNVKELYGQYQFPLAIARGTGKATGKAKAAALSGIAMASLFFGLALATGQTATAFGEAGSIPATPFQVTVANTATFIDDLGVLFALTGLPLKKVASAPTTGQYSVSGAGVYTFAAADTLLAVLISYTYAQAGTGQKMTISNQLLGTTPTFQCNFFTTFQGKPLTFRGFSATSSKLGLASKLEDFIMPDFEFNFNANAAGNIGELSWGEVS